MGGTRVDRDTASECGPRLVTIFLDRGDEHRRLVLDPRIPESFLLELASQGWTVSWSRSLDGLESLRLATE